MDSLETLRRKNYQEILERIIRNFEDGREIYGLDVGCARGWFLDEAAKHGIEMDGIEPEYNFFLEAKNTALMSLMAYSRRISALNVCTTS